MVPALARGTRLGHYEVVAPLGSGGMGEVYRARDPRLGREVAVKVLPGGLARDPERLRRFEQEAKAIAGLSHPHILAVYDTGRAEGAPYLVLELLEGQTLRERLGEGAVPPRKAVELAAQVARGLAAAHEKGVVHRDLKPENVFVCRDGTAKILDFGVARLLGRPEDGPEEETAVPLTSPGTLVGTVAYMSPEQIRGRPVDARSDIFSLGVVLYEMLAGRRPFRGETAPEIQAAILHDEPEALSGPDLRVPAAVEGVVRRCLEKRKEERFDTARDVALSLEVATTATGAATPAAPRRSPRRWLWTGLALALAALLAGGAFRLGARGAGPSAATRYHRLTFRRGAMNGAAASIDGAVFLYSAQWDGGPPRVYSTRIDAPGDVDLGIEGWLVGIGGGDLYALRRDEVLVRATLAGTGVREVAEGVERADVSRDGSQIALVRRVGGRDRLECPPGTTLYETAGEITGLRLSARGGRIALVEQPNANVTHSKVGVLDSAGRVTWLSPIRRLTIAPVWSPDSREIWFSTEEGEEWALRAVTLAGRERLLMATPQLTRLDHVLPDGRVLLEMGEAKWEVWGRGADATRDRDVSWLLSPQAFEISNDGRAVVVTANAPARTESSAHIVRFDGRPPVRLGEGAGNGLSPDGRWVATLVDRYTGLVLLPTGPGEARRLPRTLEYYYDVRFLPDGERLLVAGNEPGRPRRLFVLDLRGGPLRPVTPEGVTTEYPIPSPDGRWVAAGTDRRTAAHALYPLEGGETRPIAGLQPGQEPLRFDGTGSHLFVRIDGGAEPSARIARLDLRTGKQEPWLEIRPPDVAGVLSIFVVYLTPDGRSYVYSLPRRLSSLYLVEGLR